jgi:polysaccharide export outer membrane protein
MQKLTQKTGAKWDLAAVVLWRGAALLLGLAVWCSLLGCQTSSSSHAGKYESGLSPDEQKAMSEANSAGAKTNAVSADSLVLREGDTIRVSFPGAPNLNVVQPIRRDGKISLSLVGEVQAAGKTPSNLEKELIDLYGPQLQVKEVTVMLESSAFPVYVTGAVLRPGKLMSDRPLKALQAIMEAGGCDYSRANLKAVRIIRTVDGRTEHFQINLRNVLDGKASDNFNLKPSDIIYVPEKFTWW